MNPTQLLQTIRPKILWIAVIFAAVFFLLAAPAHAEGGIRATLTPNRDSLTVGDPVELLLDVTHPAGQQVLIPKLEQTWGSFEVQAQSPTQTQANPDGTETTRQRITVTLFEPGTFQTPPLPLTITGSNGQITNAEAGPVSLTVTPTLAEGDTALADIRPQAEMELPLSWPIMATGAAALLAVTIAGWWLIRRRRGRVAVDNRPPYQRALDELARIETMNLPARGHFKEQYTRVTDVLRLYLETQHAVPATDRTTNELKQDLARAGAIHPDHVRRLIDLFSDADWVKFAKVIPEREEAGQLIPAARQLVQATRPRPEPETPQSGMPRVNSAPTVEVSR